MVAGPFEIRVEEAVREIKTFYRVYHSARYVGDQLVLRLPTSPPASVIDDLNSDFKDILVRGSFELRPPLPAEASEPELHHLPRLVFAFNKRDFARLRLLIDRLNASMPSFEPENLSRRYDPTLNGHGNGGDGEL